MINGYYFQQTQLMLQLLPIVAQEKCFALKGGTAINFFIQDLPRYSVDIDLTYIPSNDREIALKELAEAAENIAITIEKTFPALRVVRQYTKQTKRLVKLLINLGNVQVKIEPNELIRQSVFPVEVKNLTPKAEEEFGAFVSMQILSTPDLYGGKICAALDRQHPRDLFDIKILLENGGLDNKIREAFVIYLASNSRPMNELLNPNYLDIQSAYETNFLGMTNINVTYNELFDVREKLVNIINSDLTSSERNFLLSLKQGEPDWNLMPIDNLEQFPAVQWKLLNVRKMREINPKKHRQAVEKLKSVLSV